MLATLIAEFLLICLFISIASGIYNGIVFYHKLTHFPIQQPDGTNVVISNRERAIRSAVIFGLQSVVLTWGLIFLFAVISYPIFHDKLPFFGGFR
jgi:hypothetical protein